MLTNLNNQSIAIMTDMDIDKSLSTLVRIKRKFTRQEISNFTGLSLSQLKHCESTAIQKLQRKINERQRRIK
jgi:NRPS condensation-like uncharacterized protein